MFIIDVITALIGITLIALFVKETHHQLSDEELDGINEKEPDDNKETSVKGSIFKVLLTRPIIIYFAIASFGYKFVYSQWSFMIPLHLSRNFDTESGTLWGALGFFNATIVVLK